MALTPLLGPCCIPLAVSQHRLNESCRTAAAALLTAAAAAGAMMVVSYDYRSRAKEADNFHDALPNDSETKRWIETEMQI